VSSPKDRAKKYIQNLHYALNNLYFKESRILTKKEIGNIIDYVKRYLSDAEYYFEKEDYITSIVCSSYAEGILDALRLLGVLEFSWPRPIIERKKVLVGGTFDIIHPGHIVFLKEAAKLGDLTVIVARDSNVKRFKGRRPINDEKHRLFVISSIKGVYKARLGDKTDITNSILEEKPDIIFLGPDQKIDEKKLKDELRKHGLDDILIIRMQDKFQDVGNVSTTAIIKRIIEMYCNK